MIFHIGYFDILVAALVMAIPYAASRRLRLGLERDLLVGSIRVFVQLMAVGYILDEVFAVNRPAPIIGVLLVMTVVAGYNAAKRAEMPDAHSIALAAGVIGLSAFALSAYIFFFVVGVKPWFNPRYVIPMTGMALNGAMSAVAVGARSLSMGVRDQRERIEAALSLGASSQQSVAAIVREALKQALIPVINSLMTAGIVQLPGTMTGQIIGGVDPVLAVRYQVVIFYMLTGITCVAAIAAILAYSRRFFTRDHQLVESRIHGA